MKITSKFIGDFHLDKRVGLLTGRNVQSLMEFFKALDIRGALAIDDIQFLAFMKMSTDLPETEIYKVFDMLDIDGSGSLEFDEFYLLICILIAINDKEEKQFLYRHSRTVFELLDEDGGGSVSAEEFEAFGFLFNFHGKAIQEIFKEFDVSGDMELDYQEFRMFTFACIDKQNELEAQKQRRLDKKQRQMEEKMRRKQLKAERKSSADSSRNNDTQLEKERRMHLTGGTPTGNGNMNGTMADLLRIAGSQMLHEDNVHVENSTKSDRYCSII